MWFGQSCLCARVVAAVGDEFGGPASSVGRVEVHLGALGNKITEIAVVDQWWFLLSPTVTIAPSVRPRTPRGIECCSIYVTYHCDNAMNKATAVLVNSSFHASWCVACLLCAFFYFLMLFHSSFLLTIFILNISVMSVWRRSSRCCFEATAWWKVGECLAVGCTSLWAFVPAVEDGHEWDICPSEDEVSRKRNLWCSKSWT